VKRTDAPLSAANHPKGNGPWNLSEEAQARRKGLLATGGNLGDNAVRDVSGALPALLADMFGNELVDLPCTNLWR
jgi:hypothetical protein